MIRRHKLTRTQVAAIPKMKALGLTYREISGTLHVSLPTIQYHLNTQNGIRVNKRKNLGHCELCGNEFKINARTSEYSPGSCSYHHWDYAKLGKGVWVCYRCHALVELVEAILRQDPEVISIVTQYLNLKHRIDRHGYRRIDDLELILRSINVKDGSV